MLPIAEAESSLWLPTQGSTGAAEVDAALSFTFWICLFFFALIVTLMVLFIVKYRGGKGESTADTAKSHTGIELVWTGIPILVVLSIFWVGFAAFLDLMVPPDDALEIKVYGQRWYWTFEYPNGLQLDSLHVPVDRPVKLTLRSEDVIHSFFVPEFRLKMDVVPGRYNKAWFEATVPGEYPIFCAEYCGTKHSDMVSTVVVHEPGGYEEWLKKAADIFSPYVNPRSLLQPVELLSAVRDGERPIDELVRSRLTPETTAMLNGWDGGSEPSEELRTGFIDDLNELIDGETIWDESLFAGIAIAEETRKLLEAEELLPEDVPQLNRFLLADAYSNLLSRGPNPIEAGEQVWERSGCASCHNKTEVGAIGPGLGGGWGKAVQLADGTEVTRDINYYRESIMEPTAKVVRGYDPKMPTYKTRLSDRQLDALLAFIESLTTGTGED